MKTITQYREEIAALMKKAGDIEAQALAGNRELTEAELALNNQILDKVDETRKIVATLERRERMQTELEKPEAALTVPKGAKIEMGTDRATLDKFPSFGAQIFAVINAARPGGSVDPRLFNAAATGLNETVPSEGGLR